MSPDYPLELKAGARALPFPWGHCPGWVAWDHGWGLSAYIGPTCLTVLHHQEALTGRSCHPPPGFPPSLNLRSLDKKAQTCEPGPRPPAPHQLPPSPCHLSHQSQFWPFVPGPKWDPIPPPSYDSYQPFKCLVRCRFLREAYLEPPVSVATETHCALSVLYPRGRTALFPLATILLPQRCARWVSREAETACVGRDAM